MNNGFYTALGTPLDDNGNLIPSSLIKHINQQIESGASGLLLMGSMGIEAFIKQSEYAKIANIGIETVDGRIPLFIGAMDNSIERVMERIDLIGPNKKIDGIVLTVPFYSGATDANVIYFYNQIADRSPYPIYLYDLAVVTKYKININVIDNLINHPNIKGMKTADWELIKKIERKYPNSDFTCLYSGLDSFDYACELGIKRNLDGMFCCSPKNAKKLYTCVNNGDYNGARKYLDNILNLRDTMIKLGLMRCFTICMNFLGMEGNFHQDFTAPIDEEVAKKTIFTVLKEIGEL